MLRINVGCFYCSTATVCAEPFWIPLKDPAESPNRTGSRATS